MKTAILLTTATASTTALVVAFYWPTVMAIFFREAIFKRAVRNSGYLTRTDLPPQCPSFESVADLQSVRNLDYAKYSGVWYGFMVSDPTIPQDACFCERFQWMPRLNDDDDDDDNQDAFDLKYDAFCEIYQGSGLYPFAIDLEGQLNVNNKTTHKGVLREGAPSWGADLIPNYVVWLDNDYQSCIKMSCEHDYLGAPVFWSIQIWTRQPVPRHSKQGRALMKKAHQLMEFEEHYVHFIDHDIEQCQQLPPLTLAVE